MTDKLTVGRIEQFTTAPIRPVRVEGVVGWQLIESAPKDGTPLLVWDGYNQTTAKWEVDYSWWEICVPSDGHVDSNCIAPTHWMRLPEPPN